MDHQEPKTSKFASFLEQACKLAQEMKENNPDINYVELSKKLDKHFPGLLEMSKELRQNEDFISNATTQADILSAQQLSNSKSEYHDNVRRLMQLNASELAKLHVLALRYALVLGLELGYIVSKLYDQQSSKDDEFDRFMKSLGMEPPKGTVQ